LYADDLILIAATEEDLIKRLNEWKNNVELWSPYGIEQTIIFLPCGFFLSSVFFSFLA